MLFREENFDHQLQDLDVVVVLGEELLQKPRLAQGHVKQALARRFRVAKLCASCMCRLLAVLLSQLRESQVFCAAVLALVPKLLLPLRSRQLALPDAAKVLLCELFVLNRVCDGADRLDPSLCLLGVGGHELDHLRVCDNVEAPPVVLVELFDHQDIVRVDEPQRKAIRRLVVVRKLLRVDRHVPLDPSHTGALFPQGASDVEKGRPARNVRHAVEERHRVTLRKAGERAARKLPVAAGRVSPAAGCLRLCWECDERRLLKKRTGKAALDIIRTVLHRVLQIDTLLFVTLWKSASQEGGRRATRAVEPWAIRWRLRC